MCAGAHDEAPTEFGVEAESALLFSIYFHRKKSRQHVRDRLRRAQGDLWVLCIEASFDDSERFFTNGSHRRIVQRKASKRDRESFRLRKFAPLCEQLVHEIQRRESSLKCVRVSAHLRCEVGDPIVVPDGFVSSVFRHFFQDSARMIGILMWSACVVLCQAPEDSCRFFDVIQVKGYRIEQGWNFSEHVLLRDLQSDHTCTVTASFSSARRMSFSTRSG